jgi:protocatechuate 3,4-dioxygenase beta subunit
MKRLACLATLAMPLAFGLSVFAADDITGKVTDSDGKPVTDARVILLGPTDTHYYQCTYRVLAEVRSGMDGTFHIMRPQVAAPNAYSSYYINAHKQGLSWGQCAVYPREKEGLAPALRNADIDANLEGGVTLELRKAASISGHVTDQKGKPVSGARVWLDALQKGEGPNDRAPLLRGLAVSAGPCAETDNDGAYTINDVPEGAVCDVYADAQGHGRFFAEETTAPARDVRIQMGPESRIRGWLKDEKSHAPVAGVRLLFFSDRIFSAFSVGPTDVQGRFDARGLEPGKYSVIEHENPEGPSGNLQRMPPIELSDGQTLENVVLFWMKGVLLSGRVLNEVTKEGIARAVIRLSPPNQRRSVTNEFSTRTDVSGEYRLRVPPGTYAVFVTQAGGNGEYTQPADRMVTLAFGSQSEDFAVKPLTLRLRRLKVVDEAGKPVAKATVWQSAFSCITDDYGQVDIPPPQRLFTGEIVPMLIRNTPGDLGMCVEPREEDPVEITVTLKKMATLTGWVRKPDGSPLAGARVRAYWTSCDYGGGGTQGEAAETDAAGRYMIAGIVPGGKYVVTVRAEGYAGNDYLHMKKAKPDPGDVVEVEPVTLESGVVLTGRVVDRKGAPVANLKILLISVRNHLMHSVTDKDGRFKFDGVAAEPVGLSGELDDRQLFYRPLTPSQFTDVQIVANPEKEH